MCITYWMGIFGLLMVSMSAQAVIPIKPDQRPDQDPVAPSVGVADSASVLEWAGGKIGGKLADSAFSWVLHETGTSGPDLADIKAELDRITKQLDALSLQMDNMSSVLSCKIDNMGYGSQAGGATMIERNRIVEVTELFNKLAKETDPTAKESYRKEIRKQMENLLTSYRDIHEFAVGNSALSTGGAIRGLSQTLKDCSPIINATSSAALVTQYNYLSYLQIQACQLVTNYYNDQQETAMALQVADTCKDYMKALKALAINVLPPGTDTVDMRTSTAWRVGPYLNTIVVAPSCRGGFCKQQHSAQSCGYGDGGDYGDIYYCNNLFGAPVWSYLSQNDSRWQLPSTSDLQTFTHGCNSGDTEAMKRCMAGRGWGPDATNSFYGGGWFVAWSAGDSSGRPDLAWSYYLFDGSLSRTNTTNNCGRVLLVRKLDAGERYWN